MIRKTEGRRKEEEEEEGEEEEGEEPLAAAHRDIDDVVSRDAEPARAQGCLAPRAAGRNLALGAAVWGWGSVRVAVREMYRGMAGGWGAPVFSGSHHLRIS